MISSVSLSYVQCYSVFCLEAETVNPAPGLSLSSLASGLVATLRLSAYSLGQIEFELGSSLCSSESGQEANAACLKD